MLSSVEKRINNKRNTLLVLDANRKTEAIAATLVRLSGLRAYGFTSKETIRL